ncbi:toll/interleukin-1 receptor domain-containing protein [Halotalea alkalilenta]|uniref:toll/interleukin-1 receptor domain-containing protein n=1 Tax=Halotalea alkalilenta TaxID=376489 RepID=UPI001B8030BA|nr:toll/interleukin-1 receptor domain-containing protein [Halotalea alkalilenta]
MVDNSQKPPQQQIVEVYQNIVSAKHPDLAAAWPIISGFNTKIGSFQGWLIVVLKHTGNTTFTTSSGLGELNSGLVGVAAIEKSNKRTVRDRLTSHFGLKPSDAIFIVPPNGDIGEELETVLQQHEFVMGLVPMKIFLSHKGADKPLVREFKQTLALLGFDPWLDEDAMQAGAELERSLLKGFNDSCAAVFFVTPNYKDENYLASEVDYALQEKRKKGDKFAIITLVLDKNGSEAVVPQLLHRYVWKEPSNHLQALREVIKALPVQTGSVYWKQ